MSANFPAKKEKRSRSPSEGNNSFVKNVTSRVTALLPSTITKWFSSPSSSNTNGSAPVAESTDSSTEDEAPETPITAQPPAKRMRFSVTGAATSFSPPETKCTSTNTESIGTFSNIQTSTSRNAYSSETNFESTRLPNPSEELPVSEIKKDNTIYSLDSSNENSSIMKKRKSLFDLNHEDNYVRNTEVNLKEPHFNPSLYASPFYNKKTKYGGTSSSYMNQPNIKHRKNASVTNDNSNNNITISQSARRVLDLLENYSSPLMEAKRISQIMKSSNSSIMINSLDSAKPSNSQRLSYKTQELHVPSIATILRLKQKSRLMDTTSAARQIIASHSSSSDFTSPVSKSQSSSSTSNEMSEKLTTKIKSRLTRINRDESTVYERIEPLNLPTAVLQIDKDNLPKFSLDASNSLTSLNSTHNLTKSSPASMPTIVSKNVIKINDSKVNHPEKASSNNNYLFSNPVTISNEIVKNSSSPNFTFGSPEKAIEKVQNLTSIPNSPEKHLSTIKEQTNSVPQSEQWKCDDCWVSNKSDANVCVCCGGKKPTKDKPKSNVCSVCKAILSQGCINKCFDCEKKCNSADKGKLSNIKIATNIDQLKWNCQDCWVKNDAGVEKCVCCGGKNPNFISNTSAIKSKLESVESTWKCEDCWIKNKSGDDKCAACGAVKPVSKTSNTKPNDLITQPKTTKSDSLLKNIAKSQSDKWECSNCLVRNDKNVSKCVCCETDKPGTVKDTEKKSFNFGVNSNITFKFGVDPKPNNVENLEVTKSITLTTPATVSETNNNNVLSKTFTFGVPEQKQHNDKSSKVEDKANEIQKSTFSFGIPKQFSAESSTKSDLQSQPLGVNHLREDTTSSVTKKDEQKEPLKIEQPKISLPQIPILKPEGLFAKSFSSPSLKHSLSNTTTATLPNANIPTFSESNASLTNPLLASTVTPSTEKALPQSGFSFSSIGIKPAINLDASPVATTATATATATATTVSTAIATVTVLTTTSATATTSTNASFTAIQTPPVSSVVSFFQKSNPVSSSSISFFQKSDSTPSTLSLFKKTENTNVPTSQPEISTTPVFSFGSSDGQNVAQPEKPKFNFTFGSSHKSEMPTVFKPIFGATADTNISTNNFALSNTNSMSAGNVLPGNSSGTLPGANAMTSNILSGGNNGLPTANPLVGLSASSSLATGNALSGNVLPTNSLPTANNMAQVNNAPALQSGGLFGTSIKKDNMWSSSSNTSNNLFVSNNNIQKPSFTFGSSVPTFNSNNANPAPTFGTPSQPTQNLFGISNQNNQPSLFSNSIQSSSQPNIFGASQPASNPASSVGMFGTPNAGVTPTFGSPNSISTFEAPSMNPTPAPTFNFGAQQPGSGIFGFGQQQQLQPQQQQQQQQQQPSGVYNFGATAAGMGTSQVQFNMGSSPYISGRRVRKAIRRTTPR